LFTFAKIGLFLKSASGNQRKFCRMGYFFGLFYKIEVKRGENGREAGEKVVVVPIWRDGPKCKNPK
jgi:hypothetical protein